MNITQAFKTLGIICAVFCSLALLAACSKEEPSATPDPTSTVAEAQVEATAADAAPGTGDETAAPAEDELAEEVLEVVEESAAEPEDTGETPIVLAQADTTPARTDWQFKAGEHYVRMVPSQPTVGGADKIEVAEFFWYGCGHCFTFEPDINRWAAGKPANVRFVRVPAMWNDVLKIHAQLYYTEEVLVRDGKISDPAGFRQTVFTEYHSRGNRMLSEEAIFRVFERFDVSAEDFNATWNSFEVSQKLRVANDLARRYSIAGVPTIIVNGKYRTGASEAGGNQKLIEVIDELVARESAH